MKETQPPKYECDPNSTDLDEVENEAPWPFKKAEPAPRRDDDESDE